MLSKQNNTKSAYYLFNCLFIYIFLDAVLSTKIIIFFNTKILNCQQAIKWLYVKRQNDYRDETEILEWMLLEVLNITEDNMFEKHNISRSDNSWSTSYVRHKKVTDW